MDDVILTVENLVTSFVTEAGEVHAIDGVSFEVKAGRTLGIVGESGCGKSVTSLSIMRLLPKPAGNIVSGRVSYKGQDLIALPLEAMHRIRGNEISMIFQEPMTALNPVHRVGYQIAEALLMHRPELGKAAIYDEVIELMRAVGIPAPERRLHEFPHQLSGGMRQRIMIAMALACKPQILIADEPTTALDVTIQAQILELLKDLQAKHEMAIIFITHDLGVIAEICDDVLVMYGGHIVEKGSVFDLFESPKHPYTLGLLQSIPRLDSPHKQPLPVIEGSVPSLSNMPEGCRFENRCPYATSICRQKAPPFEAVTQTNGVRCFHWRSLGSQ